MAGIGRSAKSGKQWTQNETDAYSLHCVYQDATTFFGTAELPAPTANPEILTSQDADAAVSDAAWDLLSLVDLCNAQQSSVIDFALALLHALEYVHRPCITRTRLDLRLLVCGEYKVARSDVCIFDRITDIIVLLVQDKCIGGPICAYPRLVAAAIATYQAYQTSRVVPGVLLDGTSQTFYKIPVTEELVRCVEHGEYPNGPTIVAVHIPDLPRPHRRRVEGMKPLDNRRIILECSEAFKTLFYEISGRSVNIQMSEARSLCVPFHIPSRTPFFSTLQTQLLARAPPRFLLHPGNLGATSVPIRFQQSHRPHTLRDLLGSHQI
ncbi:hypothetical protein C8R47DRAFT_1060040 [Mycena vitilis]|nr:hypothetical protein C8R47DRAFT_1060040 [Mycena vitilis]